jgi:peptide/nickel transport system permease protein
MNRRASILLGAFVVALHAPILFANFFAPYSPSEQNRDFPYSPPNRPHFIDASGQFHLRPFIYAWKAATTGTDYEADRSKPEPIYFFVRSAANQPIHLFGLKNSDARIFLFGSDAFGRDQLSRVLYGGRISLLAGFLGTAIALAFGVTIGLLSGYFGKWTDATAMRLTELFLALPWLYLLFAVRALLPLRIRTTDTFLLLIAIVGFVGWARPARIVRGLVLSAREKTFVHYARAMGASHLHILRWHIVPQVARTALTMAAYLVPQFILAEVTLSFLGLGIGEPVPSWGNLLAQLQTYSVLVSDWWMYLPVVVIVLFFLAYHWLSQVLEARFSMVGS